MRSLGVLGPQEPRLQLLFRCPPRGPLEPRQPAVPVSTEHRACFKRLADGQPAVPVSTEHRACFKRLADGQPAVPVSTERRAAIVHWEAGSELAASLML